MYLLLAPMDGYTDLAYRLIVKRIFKQYNQTDKLLLTTEFMSADGYQANPNGLVKHLFFSLPEKPIIAQIFGSNEINLIATAVDIEKRYKFQGIELNIGCPAKKILNCGGGSALLHHKERTLQIIRNIKKNIKLPLSIKTRIGLTNQDKEAQKQFLLAASNYCYLMTIHGRTTLQGNTGDVDWQFIYQIKETVKHKSIIIGNGGIKSYQEAIDKKQNLDGIMIGQAAIGNPWIFTTYAPTITEKFKVIIRHLQLLQATEIYFLENITSKKIINNPKLIDLQNIIKNMKIYHIKYNNRLKTVLEFRKHLFRYIAGFSNNKILKHQASIINDYHQLIAEINSNFNYYHQKNGKNLSRIDCNFSAL